MGGEIRMFRVVLVGVKVRSEEGQGNLEAG
jgi:hypothetical protein